VDGVIDTPVWSCFSPSYGELSMSAVIFIRGEVGPSIISAFKSSVLYEALSRTHNELVLWAPLNQPSDGYSYCTVTSELNGVVQELAVIRLAPDRLEEQIELAFGEKVWASIDRSSI
jgi:hypothetical protein